MFRKIMKIAGVTLLTFSLGSAFLSEENVLIRTRGAKSNRVSGKSQLSGSHLLSSQKSTSEEGTGTKDLEDIVTWNGKGVTGVWVSSLTSSLKDATQWNSHLLSHQYLNLPPPV
ncbi:hypothetical protein EHQ92_06350 [Leptospira biflexa]|jgi:hypothetical protein|uniref:hypothetical protein n=2 Tax=Leptospira biflexa TaxID=172 RepID=UPI00108394AA|nr:hypothetical protein [Leptospira biflexa]TGM37996.1 hypothetical protein EHQ80_10535 [Leptospira biflexa]TGM41327.1 hypothetical protein EHQ89_05100 [Leptospira biflexa]TGM47530.1 hypothetical protein EHQ92_06350 [Leptospira biflexa]TGM50004.1 hypothetical protein EHQ88_06735 [Leptospira biflexa]TGM55271.1 hypothetical protein EHQ91_10050 [Leptospira biflexa]